MDDKALTIKEVAKFLNISNQMVYNLIKDEQITAFKIGSASRILYSDLLNFIQKQKDTYRRSQKGKNYNQQDGLFQIENLSMKKESFLVEDISFQFPAGKILTILGPSGSGKSLILRSIAGLENITNGTIINNNTNLEELEPHERKIGFVFENYALFPHLDVDKNIKFPLDVKKWSSDNKRIGTELRKTELDIDSSYSNKLPKSLPEGVKQLVAIARERNNPIDLFLLDEPMTKLDADLHRSIRVFIKKIIGDMGKTTIISSNNSEDALIMSDYLAIIDNGRLIQFGETWDVYHNPNNLKVLECTSLNATNTISIKVQGGFILPFNIKTDKIDGNYILAFRAEDVRLSEDGITCTIENVSLYDGNKSIYRCKTDFNSEISLILPKGEKDNIVFSPEHYYLYN